jgi:hypothetical protein
MSIEQNVSTLRAGSPSSFGIEPSKNIKSTIALLERSNAEWQAKVARLTEQLGHSESLSRTCQRELARHQKLLHEAGSLLIFINSFFILKK